MCNDNALATERKQGPVCILVVEDSFDLRFTLSEWLRNQKYIVYEATSADEAKTLLSSSFSIDMVITDIEMPGSINGLGLVDYIKESNPCLNIAVVSGNDKHSAQLRNRDIPFFKKPYDLRQVSALIERLFKNQSEQG